MAEMNLPPVNFKDNFMKFIRHEKTDFIPPYVGGVAMAGFGALPGPWIEKGPLGGGYDGFGVRWITPASGGGAPIPAPNEFVLEDITEWREVVKFPDVEAFDWEADAAAALKDVDRSQMILDFGCGNGMFERLAALMGFEEALCAIATEPEEVNELLTAITDYKIKVAEKVAKYYKADTFTNYDDVATERGMFMSPETFRKLFKPHNKRLCDAVKALGMIPIYHCCGKADDIVEDMIDCGYAAWTSVQPSNDICGIIEKYGDRFGIMGGYDTSGRPGQAEASDEEVRAEVRRCLDTYGKYGRSYCFMGVRLVNSLDPAVLGATLAPVIEESIGYAMALMAKNAAQ